MSLVISVTAVHRPRKEWSCDHGGGRECQGRIGRRPHLRMYGSSGGGERPYVLRVCIPCAVVGVKVTRREKTLEALRELGVEVTA